MNDTLHQPNLTVSPRSKNDSSGSVEPAGKCTVPMLALDSKGSEPDDAMEDREAKTQTPRFEAFELGNDSDAEDAEQDEPNDIMSTCEPENPERGFSLYDSH